MDKPQEQAVKHPRPWQPLELRYIGDAHAILTEGGGKLTPPAVDPGEPRKTQPSG
jgi:hypothetical protein